MPPKTLTRTRTWGTRFDSLLSSPKNRVNTLNNDGVVPSQVTSMIPTAKGNESDAIHNKMDSKMPHDASIFVGSLPANIEQIELARLLSEHLSEYAEVKNIKVVRDSKGGVCAFVQCEDASAAASLIHTIHSSPARLFLGRFLRYEPARAFRTLLISYRAPTQFIPPGLPEVDTAGNFIHKEGRTVEVSLPTAMRLWKPHSSKYFNILYNAEAHDSNYHSKSVGEPTHGTGLFIYPLSFDAKTIQTLCEFFGPVEHFRSYAGSTVGTESAEPIHGAQTFPFPHHAPRSNDMDPGCWEIKWNHRDDCVSALMTLRRVPHLTVTWAHQPHSQGYEHHPYQAQRRSHSDAYPLHVHGNVDSPIQSTGARLASPSRTPGDVPRDFPLSPPSSRAHASGTLLSQNAPGAPREPPATLRNANTGNQHFPGTHDEQGQSTPNSAVATSPLVDTGLDHRSDWTEGDFPPLSNAKGDRRVESGVWGGGKTSKEVEEVTNGCVAFTHFADPSAATTLSVNTNQGQSEAETDGGQELEIPPTPEFGRSPNTPKTSSFQFPKTPTTSGYAGDTQPAPYNGFEARERSSYSEDANVGAGGLDPTTIFVGGLEMFGPNAWDERKVHAHFAKFGGVENVKVVRPANSRSAFAFVKFNNTEGPARAVSDEHNRVFDGRPIRVQLRDCNPQNRGGWKYHSRSRGRIQHNNGQRSNDGVKSNLASTLATREQLQPEEITVQHLHVLSRTDSSLSPVIEASSTGRKGDHSISGEVPVIPVEVKQGQIDETAEPCLARQSDSAGSRHASPEVPVVKEGPAECEHYREWYEQEPPSAPRTPPSSSLGSSASASAPPLPYPLPAPGYYPPPWMSHYPQPFPYPMAFVPGYGYAIPPQQASQQVASPPGSDSGAPAATALPSWPAMYPPVVPYAAYQMGHPHPQAAQLPQAQAPLIPTGFMQGEHGTLIPVYPPDALDQYMSGTQTGTQSSQTQPAAHQAQWAPYPHPPPFNYANPAPPAGAPMASAPSQQFGIGQLQHSQSANAGWNAPSAAAVGPPSQNHPTSHVVSNNLVPVRPGVMGYRNPSYLGGPQGQQQQPHFEQRPAPPPRRQYRRDQDHHGHTNRNQNGHTGYSNNRYGRNNVHRVENDHDYVSTQQVTSLPSQPSFNGGPDWTQWAPAR